LIQPVYQFGPFKLEPGRNRLIRDGLPVQLRRKTYELLLFLLERRGTVITKEELVERLWPGQMVEESNLSQHIYQLRSLLGESPTKQPYIQTVPRIGYNFAYPVDILPPEPPALGALTNGMMEGLEDPFLIDTGEISLSSPFLEIAESDSGPAAATNLPVSSDVSPGEKGVRKWIPRGSKVRLLLILVPVLLVALSFAYWALREESESVVTIEPFTTLSGMEQDPAFSPDGNLLAFSSEEMTLNNRDIYVKLVNKGEPLRITSHPQDDFKATWSPDSKLLAYLRRPKQCDTKSEVVIIPALGGSERVVTEASDGLDWSPDGRKLVLTDTDRPGGPMGLYLVSTSGTDRTRITNRENSPQYHDSNPKFSPDGNRIAFLRSWSHTSADVYLVDLQSRQEMALTRDRGKLTNLDWSPDGRKIYFVSNRMVNQRIWSLDLQTGALQMVKGLPIDIEDFALSPDGKTLAYVQAMIDTVVDLRPLSPPSPTPPCVINSSRGDDSPRLSPNGKKLVFVSNRSGFYELWLSNSDCTENIQLTRFSGHGVGSPRWSPDGRAIVFDRSTERQTEIYRIQADGTGLVQLTIDPSEDAMPAWSSDGSAIYFTSARGGEHQIWKMPSEGGPAQRVTSGPGRDAVPSADGRLLYFLREGALWQKQLPDGEENAIPELARFSVGRFWSLDLSRLHFVTQNHEEYPKIYQFDLGRRQITSLGEVPGFLPRWVPGISASGAGNRMAIAYVRYKIGDIMLAKGWEK
jgi:Tol biopolymer transport system component/DNA-binding winged helix-turn-helix (wHTH) protein